MSDAALIKKVTATNIFAEIEPNQKERIILALKKSGNVVGYMGDGINDASALHSAVKQAAVLIFQARENKFRGAACRLMVTRLVQDARGESKT